MALIGTKNEQGAYPAMFFQESQTWACPVAMEAIVYVIGAGGSGSRIGDNSWNTYNGRGGGAGGCAVSRLTLAAQSRAPTPRNPPNRRSPPNRPFGRLRSDGSISPNSLLKHDRNAPRAPFICPSPASQPVIILPPAGSVLTVAPTH